MNKIHYQATCLEEINCDMCDVFLCSGFIEHAFDCGFLCPTCKKQKELEEIPEITRQKQEELAREEKEMLCGESTEGHNWIDITHNTFCMGSTVFNCTKCDAQKLEPIDMGILNIGEIQFQENVEN